MGEYYDKEKFTGSRGSAGSQGGGTPPPPKRPYQAPPPPRQQKSKSGSNSGWYSWPVIIILFSLGIWPVALVLLFFNLFGDGRRKSVRQSSDSYDRQRAADEQRQAESAVERAMRRAESRMDNAEDKVDEAIERAMEHMGRTLDRAAKQVEQAGRNVRQNVPPPPPRTQQAPPKAAAKPAKQKKAKTKPAGVLLRLIGIIFMAVAGIIGLDFLSEVASGYYVDFENFFAAAGFGFAGALMFFRGHYLNKMSRRSQRYILAIGNVDAMPIDEIAKRVNRKPAQAEKELQKLIDKGYLGEDAYIDHERGYFLRFGATLEEEEEEVPFEEEVPQPTPREAQEGYSGILRNIRRANDRIADPELSRKIDRLEQISGLIFKEVEQHPEKRGMIHTFFDYYLPTTQKLLDTYADFEETGVEGENLREAKERIEQTMDLIVAGFEHQLDQLYSSDAMDVASDIQVMKAMLKRDTASAAKDFGYDEGTPHLTLNPEEDRRDQGGHTQAM